MGQSSRSEAASCLWLQAAQNGGRLRKVSHGSQKLLSVQLRLLPRSCCAQ